MASKKSKGARIVVTLECTSCAQSARPGVSRYTTTKNRRNTPGRLELRKYCRYERKHTLHREIR
ncbi:MAG TPA: 50S ribosomal protein L33 [Armatimonadetes bacterium]|nr:50S ribosomal protein L33 [Armatimonadota bacterium]